MVEETEELLDNKILSAQDIAVEIKTLEEKMKAENPGLTDKIVSSVTGLVKNLIGKFFSKEFIPESEPVKSDKEKRNIFLIDKIPSVLKFMK